VSDSKDSENSLWDMKLGKSLVKEAKDSHIETGSNSISVISIYKKIER